MTTRPSVLVTGGTGFIGRALCQELFTSGYDLRVAVRSPERARALSQGVAVPVGDVGPKTNWDRALDGVEVVVHLAARAHVLRDSSPDPLAEFRRINWGGTQALATAAAERGVRRLVFLSSIGVNGHESGPIPFTEATRPQPHSVYAVAKWEAELELARIAARTGLEVVIIRPPLVYGPGAPGNFRRLLALVDSGVPLPVASIANARSMVFLANLVDFIIEAVINPLAAGETFLVADAETVSTPELIRRLARLRGSRTRLFPMPGRVLTGIARATGWEEPLRQLTGSLIVSIDKARQVLGWNPPHSLTEGLFATAKKSV